MLGLLFIAGAIWFAGDALGASKRARWILIAALFLAVLVVLLVFPLDHPLPQALGGTAGEWIVVGGLIALAVAYSFGLRWLREKASDDETLPNPKSTYQGDEIERYARHIMLREIGGAGQKRLKEAKVWFWALVD